MNGAGLRRALAAAGCCLILWAAAASAEECASCHDQGRNADPRRDAHAGLGCAVCHDGRDEYPHAAGALKPGSTAFRSALPETCGACHDDVARQFQASVHGKAVERGVARAPVCTDCHGEHSIEKHTSPASPVNPAHIRETCGRCHGDVRLARKFGLPADRVLSFDASFHGLAAKAGSQSVANCGSCHGVHNILPSKEPHSTIHAANLPATCGRCHAGAGRRFSIGPVHVAEGRTESKAVVWVRRFYLLAIPVLAGLMALHNAGDWIRKLVRIRFAGEVRAAPEMEVRMLGFERAQHALLAASFFALAWTGFALKYPDGFWAGIPGRGTIHRWAAALFMAVALAHAASLAAGGRLRAHWMLLLPRRGDAAEGLARFGYNLGLRREPPPRTAHGYVEKAEYWAVVWGSAVMIVSGLMLWANDLMLRWLPKSMLDIATSVHFYEAVLATLAILVWHFYSVIFDPDVYPMDTAWLTGRGARKGK